MKLDHTPDGECLGHLGLRCPFGRTLQRLDPAGAVDVDHGVELHGEAGVKVVAGALGIRPIDHADGALEPRLAQAWHAATGEREQEAVDPHIVEERLVAFRECRTNTFELSRRIPARGRRDRPFVGGEAHQHGLAAKLAGARAGRDSTRPGRPSGSPGRRPGANCGPRRRPWCSHPPVEEFDQGFERFCHVMIAQVPGRDLAPVHRAVVSLGVAHQTGILLGVELIVLGQAAVAQGVRRRITAEVDEL